jgi:hypothetical protein
LKGYAETKGWENIDSAVDSYRNFEKLQGVPAEQIIKMPKPGDKEAWAQVYTKLGRPEQPDHYKLPVPEGDKGEFAKLAQGWFHELGLSTDQGRTLAGKWNEFVTAQTAQAATSLAAAQQTAVVELKKEWGAAHPQNEAIANRTAEAFGMTQENLVALRDVMGPAAAMKFLYSIGSRMGEDNFITGGQQGFKGVMTPGAAQAKIKALKADPDFVQKYSNGGAKETEEMVLLLKLAYPDTQPAA